MLEPFIHSKMNKSFRKLVISTASIIMGVASIILIFAPDLIVLSLATNYNIHYQSFLQITGAVYFGFAAFNWMNRSRPTGGIYNRPLVISNFVHWLIGSLVSIKYLISIESNHKVFIGISIIYLLFFILFSIILFRSPEIETSSR